MCQCKPETRDRERTYVAQVAYYSSTISIYVYLTMLLVAQATYYQVE